MGRNKEMKTKKKALIPVLASVAALAICALCALGILLSKQNPSKDAAIQLERNEAGEMLATDESTLRQLLKEDKTYTILVSEDITVKEPLEVNGTKTLVGDKSIIMDLNTEAKERVLSVSAAAHLILDGVTIDGNGVCSGIAVKADGTLECLSGNIVYPMPYGIVTEGKVTIEDITIDRSMHTGIYVESGGELYMSGGQITNCIQTGIATSKKAYAKVSQDCVITQSAGSLFYNYGTLDITGGTYSESYSNCIYNKGELNIISESDKLVEFFNSGRSIISSVAGTTVTIDGLYAHDMAAHVMNLEKDSIADVKNVLVENSGKSCFYTNGSTLTMEAVELKDIKSVGINITNKSTAQLTDITITNGGHRGIINDSSTVTMTNITADNLVGAGIVTIGENSNTTIDNAKISKVGKSGIGITGGTVTAKNIEITDAAGTAIYTTTAQSKTTIDGAKLVNSGKSAIGVSVGSLTATNVEINGTKNTGVYIQAGAKLTLTSATMRGVNKHGIANYSGTAAVRNVRIEAPASAGILNKGTLTGEKVTINNSGSRAVSLTDASVTNIDGLVINKSKNQAVYIDNVTQAHISNFTVDKSGQSAFRITKSTDVLLKTGEITNANGDGVWVSEGAKIKVQDTVIKAPTKYGVEVYAAEGMAAEVTAVNVTVNNARAGFVNNGGTLNGSTLAVNDSISRSLNLVNKGTTSITGLTVKNAGDQGVYIEGTEKVVLKEISIDTTKGAAIRAGKAKNVSIQTGTIKNAGSDGVYVCDEAAIKVEAVDISDAAGYGLMVAGAELTAIDVGVTNVKAGLVNNGGTVNANTVSIDTTTSRAVSLISGSTTEITGLTVKNAGDQGVYIEDTEKVVLKEFDIDTTKGAAIRAGKAKNVSIKTGTIKNAGSDGINVCDEAAIKVEAVDISDAAGYGLMVAGAELTAIDVDVTNVKAGLVNDGGTVNANTVSIDTTTSRGLSLVGGSTTEITGLTVKNAGNQGVYAENSTVKIATFTVDTTQSAAFCLGKTEEIDEAAVENVTLTNGRVSNSGSTGIYVGKTAVASVTGVTIENSKQHGIQNAGGKLTGATLTINQSANRAVTLAADSETTIDGLNITGTGDQAVYVDGAKESKTEIKGFNISGSGSAAVRVMNTTGVKLTNGTINATTYGIAISGNASAVAEDVRVIRQENNPNYLVWIMANSSLTMSNGEETAEEKQSLVDGREAPGIGVWIEKGGSFNLKGGTIANSKGNTSEGAGVYVCEGASFVMDGGVIKNNETTNTSGGVAARGAFTLNGGSIQENKASKGAGVMVRSTGTFTMTGGEISGNIASADGGGIFIQTSAADVNITGGTIQGNKANAGGGIYMSCSKTVNMTNATVQKNETATNGGGVYVNQGVFTMSGGTIADNKTPSDVKTYGAGVYLASGTFNLNGGSICNHGVGSATEVTTRGAYEGAGVCAAGTSVVNMNGGSISNNYVSGSGAGVSVMDTAKFIMNDGTISQNTAQASGGAMIVRSARKETVEGQEALVAAFVMNGGTISGNSALVNNANGGGAIFQHKNTKIEMNAGTISGNKSSYSGGGVLVLANSVFTMKGGTIKENRAEKYGAGVLVFGSFNMDGGEISNHGSAQNPLAIEGAGVCLDGASATFTMGGGEIKNNYATKAGAGVSVRNGDAAYPKFTMNGGAITANQTTGSAAGIVVRTGVFTMNEGSVISDNTAGNLGGGLYLAGSATFYLNGGTFANNSAAARGKDIYLEGKITLQKALTDEISISPSKYTEARVIALNGEMPDVEFKNSMKMLAVEDNNGTSWHVNKKGELQSGELVVTVVLDGVGYASLSEALADVGEDSTIEILQNQEISAPVEVAGKLTLTSAESVTITAGDSLDGNMFNVANGGTLVINGAAADQKITLAGGSATDYVINNNATVLLSNVDITGGVRGIHHGSGTLGTVETPLSNVTISNASEYGVYVYTGNVNIGSITVNAAGHSAIYIQKEGATVSIRKAELNNSGSYGLVVKKGTVTVKNTVIDNGGITDTSKNRIGIAAHGGILNLDNVTVKNFAGSSSKNNNHGVDLAGSQLTVTANETVDGGNKGLYIYNVKGHGIYATKGTMDIAKVSIEGNGQIRAGIRIYASETMTNVIASASITGCAADVQIKNTTLTIHGVVLTAGGSQVQKTIDEINAMK